MNQYDCAVVVPSCDGYEDAWMPFFEFFFKYWPDCPFTLYLITEKKVHPDPRVKTLALGEDFGWTGNMEKVLNEIPEQYFLYFLEDVFLTEKVNTKRILDYLDVVKKEHISCLRLFPEPGANLLYDHHPDLGLVAQNAPYRVSTMTAIWDKNAFLRLLKKGENAWQFELEGTKRSAEMNELFVSVWPGDYAIKYFATAIKKGKWIYDAVKLCQREGVEIKTKRPIESYTESLLRKFSHLPIIGGVFRRI